jgi:hypothetical protein
MNYVDVSYATYNTRSYYLSIIILILYIAFISKLFIAVKFEVLNKRNECDINFYYGKPCRNYITNNILTDNRLISAKQQFFNNTDQKITPTMDTDATFASIEERNIGDHIKKNTKMLNNNKSKIQSQFQAISQALNHTFSTILGNFSGLLNTFNINNSDILNGMGNLQQQLGSTPGAIKPILNFMKPTIASSIAPLQKLYQSLTSPSGSTQ